MRAEEQVCDGVPAAPCGLRPSGSLARGHGPGDAPVDQVESVALSDGVTQQEVWREHVASFGQWPERVLDDRQGCAVNAHPGLRSPALLGMLAVISVFSRGFDAREFAPTQTSSPTSMESSRGQRSRWLSLVRSRPR